MLPFGIQDAASKHHMKKLNFYFDGYVYQCYILLARQGVVKYLSLFTPWSVKLLQ